MIRRIIEINEEKCNGCGICAEACHEGAIGMKDGKATLLRDDYCDGLGDCLPTCPTGAISFVEREALAYDDEAVKANMAKNATAHQCPTHQCPSSQSVSLEPADTTPVAREASPSQLRQWPVQLKLVPVQAPFYQNATLLIAADCAGYAYGNFHEEFMRGKTVVIGCPKLDEVNYGEKLEAIIRLNDIKQVTIVRMEVPCCGGIEQAAKTALQKSGKFIPWQVVTISTDGKILEA